MGRFSPVSVADGTMITCTLSARLNGMKSREEDPAETSWMSADDERGLVPTAGLEPAHTERFVMIPLTFGAAAITRWWAS